MKGQPRPPQHPAFDALCADLDRNIETLDRRHPPRRPPDPQSMTALRLASWLAAVTLEAATADATGSGDRADAAPSDPPATVELEAAS